MSLAPGARLGPYEVSAQIGVGGMGEVYRATDTKLKRQVAIKVLPEAVANDPERLARFRREAEVLAALNHPNIAAIYGLEDSGDTHALVMELVEGPTLDEVIRGAGGATGAADEDAPKPSASARALSDSASAAKRRGWAAFARQGRASASYAEATRRRGPAETKRSGQGLPVDDALPIAKQIAEALEAAHEQGIIHRDLKPANIKVREDGTVKVLDFGLAKALGPEEASATAGASPGGTSLSMSPTITTPAMTQMGMILGTAAYMSPEQAKGRSANRRSDVWAFGAVLYEMLTGRRAFQGEDVSETMASVLKADTDWTAFPADVPASVVAVIRRCLERDPKRRLRDIGDVWLALEEAVARGDQPVAVPVTTEAKTAWPVWVAATAVVTTALAAAIAWSLWPAEAPRSPTRFSHVVPDASALRRVSWPVVAISPDGRSIVYNTEDGLYLRDMDALEARLIQGSEEDLAVPFFSPDGQQIAYFTPSLELKRIATTGGVAVRISNVQAGVGGASWARDGRIFFRQEDGIYQVPASGGTPERVIVAEEGERLDAPELLPDGETVLFTAAGGASGWDEAQVVAASLRTGERTVLIEGGSDARYSPTGHLVYAVGEDLLGVAFDPDRLAVFGGPVPLLQGLARPNGPAATANYGFAEDGTLVYLDVDTSSSAPTSRLVWVDRDGRSTPLDDREEAFESPRLSPAGDQVAVSFPNAEGNVDIWVLQVARHTWRRLTTDAARDIHPLWTPDGRRIVFASNREGTSNALYWVPADGSGEPEALTKTTDGNEGATAWSPDGRLVFYRTGVRGYDLFTVIPGEEPVPLPQTEFDERSPALSPDGAWLAYASDETGEEQVYVMPFSGQGGQTVSTTGGRSPRWSANGRELFYRHGTEMMVVDVTLGSGSLDFGSPRLLFDEGYVPEGARSGNHNYDVTGDGQRFLMLTSSESEAQAAPPARIIVVKDWFEELKRVVPTE